jgi:hypothetical protein
MPVTEESKFDHYSVQLVIAKATALIILAIGAVSPNFRHDDSATYVSIVCVAVLTILAGTAIFRRRRK